MPGVRSAATPAAPRRRWRAAPSTARAVAAPAALIVALCSGMAKAHAQVYVEYDAQGVPSFSDVRISGAQQVYLDAPAPVPAVAQAVPGVIHRDADAAANANARAPDAIVARHLDEAARRHGLDAALVHAIARAESGYRQDARSPRGAMGLMQLMPATARELGLTDPYDARANADAGALYLRRMLDRFGDLQLALAAYNAGPAAVERHGYAVPPFAQTRAYVRRVQAFWRAAGARATQGAAPPTEAR